jgi:hypothetical protein
MRLKRRKSGFNAVSPAFSRKYLVIVLYKLAFYKKSDLDLTERVWKNFSHIEVTQVVWKTCAYMGCGSGKIR